ncbi:glycoside hydrolase family 88 protein [Hymenobacter sp. 5317J-9]|uniref:glycoside hydrolase family 88 protein n=1 Tax=Hymenobacter sp. 5317J-9 TaxID=2932250 RepID=UPI001FD6F962|nr:glycoside hydrolase family 88 protein [Hymenobacter sp. 5317J-9]UOQ98699.1 glycoside hydrolase family 88 protein [Hymenobacter sp. 5317J-9]
MNAPRPTLLLLLALAGPAAAQKSPEIPVDQVVALAEAQYAAFLRQYPDSTRQPRSTQPDGSLQLTTSRNWTSGFFAGNLWQLARFTGKDSWRRRAAARTETLEAEKFTTDNHDLGFILNNSFGQGYAQAPTPKYREVLLQGAATLSRRFSPKVGAIRSWDFAPFTYPVIVDNLMNLDFLFVASKLSGDTAFAHLATAHANTDLKYRFRKDYSTFHVLDFDPATGQLRKAMTHQGYADQSCWARGQAWAIYGYAMLYRNTRDPRYLAAAQHAADYFLKQTNRIPDHIPYWDFNAPDIPNSPRDASAAAIAASGLLELSKYAKSPKKYYQGATGLLSSLCTPQYLATAGTNNFFLLKHATGYKPANSEVDVPLVYADYYLLEALWRYQNYNQFLALL